MCNLFGNGRVGYLARRIAAPAFVGSLAFAVSSANADVIALYTFDGETATSTVHPSSDTDVSSTASDFFHSPSLGTTGNWNSSVSGVDTTLGNPAPSFAQKPRGGLDQNASFTNDAFLSFTVTPAIEMDLIDLTFDLTVRNSTRPIGYYLSSNVSGFATPIGSPVNDRTTGGLVTFDLSGSEFQDLTSGVEFRLYLWDKDLGGSSGSSWLFDNITLNGTTTVIPEPVSLALLVGGGLMMSWRKRR